MTNSLELLAYHLSLFLKELGGIRNGNLSINGCHWIDPLLLRSWVPLPHPVHFFLRGNYGIELSLFSFIVGQEQVERTSLKHLFHHAPNLSCIVYRVHIEMMTTSERKNNRGKIQIMGDVLALATSGIKKTHIMYRANLSYEQVHLYLGDLIGKRLIVQDVSSEDGVVYRTTEKGREFLLHYTRLVEFLVEEEAKQDPEVELSSPYISSRSWVR